MNREILVALLGTLLALVLGYALLQSTSPESGSSQPPAVSSARSASGALSENFSPSFSEKRAEYSLGSPEPPADAAHTERAGSAGLIAAVSKFPSLAAAEAEWTLAAANHEAAQHALEESEQSLNEVEREIDAVERFIEDLEERGDDPEDYAEEGMAKLGPAIDRFEARLEIVESYELLELEARARLEAAETELTRQQTVLR